MKAQRELVHKRISESIACSTVEEARFGVPYHFHPEIEIALILEGAGTRMIGDSIASFTPGDFCLIGQSIPHLYSSQLTTHARARAEVIQFSREEWSGLIDTIPEMQAISKLLDRSQQGLQFSSGLSDRAARYMERIRQAKGPARVSLFIEFLDLLTENLPQALRLVSPGFAAEIDGVQSRRIDTACQYILAHSSSQISHRQVASLIGLSPAAFSRLFRRATKMTFTAFIGEVRLGHASRLLLETRLPVSQIAFDTGFSNLSNFNRRFRQRYGVTPSQFRQAPADTSSNPSALQ